MINFSAYRGAREQNMNNVNNRFGAFSVALFFTLMLGSLPMAPTAHGITVNSGINEAGQWTRSGPGFVANATTGYGEDLYIIRHQAPSLAQYRGDIPGLAATSPAATGASRLDTDSAASQAYLAYLTGLHANLETAIEARLGKNVDVAYRYDAVFNGIAVRMNPAEAQSVSTLPGIRSITRDYSRELQTDNGPHWIGADKIWGEGDASLPTGNADCLGNCGEGVVAGVIDTGVNFNHPSFADVGGDDYDHDVPADFGPNYLGACSAQVVGTPGLCNDKLIGYYDFTGTGPEDDNGHGSHTASTTAGNVLDIELVAPTITVPRKIAGVAPHANIISYKGCSGTPVGCLISALLASINAATLDKVDVINYSIGGSSANPWTDLDAQAFFDAYTAGIFVATSASNDGPGFGTLGSPADAPWVTSVGASTHDRKLANGIVNMKNNGGTAAPPADIFGASVTAPLPAARVVYAGDYGAPLCGAGTGDPATGEGSDGNPFAPGTFNGEIVLCDRGEYGRVHKSENVYEAGAGGYVLANDEANGDSLVGDAYPLPGVHISYDNGLILKQWITANGGSEHQGTGEIKGSNPDTAPENGDIMASFSSRGANPAAPSLIKPDVTAPGVDILAAWMASPEVTLQDILLQDSNGEQYNIISGTSMSSPHTAGSGALIRGVHPTWTPDEVKSALMTTAFNRIENGANGAEVHGVFKEDAVTPADPFDMGAGRVDLHVAANAGFVLNETAENFVASDPANSEQPDYVDMRQLNIASLGDDNCGALNVAETCSWTRTLRGTADAMWTIVTTPPAGASMTVRDETGNIDNISSFQLNAGEEKELTFTLNVSGSAKGDWVFGEVRFLSSNTTVPNAHFPIAVIPREFGGGGGSGAGVKFYFHGNTHDACGDTTYSGNGQNDVLAGCDPFLSTDPVLDEAAAASFGPITPSLEGDLMDPHWNWTVAEPVQLLGNMTVEWWAGQTAPFPLSDTTFQIELLVDGNAVAQDLDVGRALPAGGKPQRLTAQLPIEDVTVLAGSTISLRIDVIYIDTGNTVTIYYDSVQPCSDLADAGSSCDSNVTLPLLVGEQAPIANDDDVFMQNGETVFVNVLSNDIDPDAQPGDASMTVELIGADAFGVLQTANGVAEVTQTQGIRYTHDGSATFGDSLSYRITDVQGKSAEADVNFTIADGCYNDDGSFSIDWENGAEGWYADTAANASLGASSNWELLNPHPTPKSGNAAWFTDALCTYSDTDICKDTSLRSPAGEEYHVSSKSKLNFWHSYRTETGFDGGVLEVSVDGGDWVDILSAGGEFKKGEYDSNISTLNNRRAWAGTSSGWPDSMNEVEVDLGALVGRKLQFRFRFIQDELLAEAGGWSIDDVELSKLLERCPGNAPIAAGDSAEVTRGGEVTTDVKGNDSDPDDNGDLSQHGVTIQTGPQHGTVMVEANGSVTYMHGGGSEPTDQYEYKLTDPDGNFDTAIVQITINPDVQNEPPVAVGDEATVEGGGSVDINVKSNDYDPDNTNAELTIEITTDPAYGMAYVNGQVITYVHGENEETLDTLNYQLTDPAGNKSDIVSVTITINHDGGHGGGGGSATEGRVHGSGYWQALTDDNADSDSDKVHFSFDAKVYNDGYKGKLKIRDKYMDLKIDAKTITSLSTGTGESCDGVAMDTMSGDTFMFTATGTMEVGDVEVENAEFMACGADNGKNKDAPYDNLYVECTNCGEAGFENLPPYNTATAQGNDIDGGNIHLHDAIVDAQPEGAAAEAAAPEGEAAAPEGEAAAPEGEAAAPEGEAAAPEGQAAEAEEPGSTDVVTLAPMLV
ncbi:MAG: S8 family serine peptidase, partial [Woeseia sp.]|nr:S8 family serine peptidase [Woeseia sp.]